MTAGGLKEVPTGARTQRGTNGGRTQGETRVRAVGLDRRLTMRQRVVRVAALGCIGNAATPGLAVRLSQAPVDPCPPCIKRTAQCYTTLPHGPCPPAGWPPAAPPCRCLEPRGLQ